MGKRRELNNLAAVDTHGFFTELPLWLALCTAQPAPHAPLLVLPCHSSDWPHKCYLRAPARIFLLPWNACSSRCPHLSFLTLLVSLLKSLLSREAFSDHLL